MILAANLEALWVRAIVGRGPSLASLAIYDTGLLAPYALALSLGLGIFFVIVEPSRATSPLASLRRWRQSKDDHRQVRLALLLLGPPALVAFATLSANLARASMMRIHSPLVSGLAMAFGAALLALSLGAISLWARPRVSSLLRRTPLSHPLLTASLGCAAAAALLAHGIAAGTTSGEGGLFGIWGVLKRPELDLRAPSLLALIAFGAWLGPIFLRRLPIAFGALLALAPLALTAHAVKTLASVPEVAIALERGAPLGKIALRAVENALGGFPSSEPFDEEAIANLEEPPSPLEAEVDDAPSLSLRERIPSDLNVILITIDTLRADLGFAGYPKAISPHLDSLAARSAVFERAYSLASYTGKSIGPFLCGKYPSETHRGWSHFNRYPKDDIMVAERLAEAGIRTMGFQAHWYFSKGSGLGRGFDLWDMSAQSGFEVEADTNVTGHKLTDAILRELSKPENVSSRFFVWAHYLDPHAEYVAHKDAPDFGKGMRAAYDGEVWFTDKQVGRLLDFIGEQPWGERTAIVVTSDHGEAFGEHGMIRHGFELWEELVRVPLIVHVPGIEPRRIRARRSLIDVVPTLLDLFHLEPPGPDAASTDFLSGQSLLEDIVGPPERERSPRDIFVDMPAGPANRERRAFIHGDLKLYISNGNHHQLFDLASDPSEKEDLYRNKELAAPIVARYRAFKSKLREVIVKPVSKD